jgi:mRNA-degrading endonuclease RelE of RelBE toxin-antitoxin system
MSAPPWAVKLATRAKDEWSRLTREEQTQVVAFLRRHPKGSPEEPRAHDHFKGKLKSIKRRCNHEYRKLSGGRRVIYRVHEPERRVVIIYAGRHP